MRIRGSCGRDEEEKESGEVELQDSTTQRPSKFAHADTAVGAHNTLVDDWKHGENFLAEKTAGQKNTKKEAREEQKKRRINVLL